MPIHATPDYEIAVYYFPQYHVDPRNEHWHGKGWTEWELVKRAEPRFAGHHQPIIPAWGYFNEADPQWAEREIELAARHGITTFLYDWYWYDGQPFLQDALEQGFLQASNNQQLKFALMWANHDWLNLYPMRYSNVPEILVSGNIARQHFVQMTDYIIDHYFTRANYLTIAGAPYFSIFDLPKLVASLGSLDETRVAFDDFRSRVRRRGFTDLHVNVIDQYLGNSAPSEVHQSSPYSLNVPLERREYQDAHALYETLRVCHVASIASYNWMPPYHWHEGPLPTVPYGEVAATNYEIWQQQRSRFTIPFFPNVMMGYDSTPRTAQSDTFIVRDYPWWPVITGNSPAAFREALEEAKRFLDHGLASPPLVTINAWNEWTEGSYLLPDQEHGMAYLEAIRAMFST